MAENKKTFKSLFWQNFSQILKHLRKYPAYLFLFVILFLSIFILWKKNSENKILTFPELTVETFELNKETIPGSVEETAAITENMKKTTEIAQKDTLGPSQKLITIQLLEGVLDGWIALSIFKTYLQRHPNEDTPKLLLELSTISNCSTYAELQSSLPSAPVKSKSLWERIKSLIRIRKIDKKKALETNFPKKIERAIYEKNIPEVLNSFEKLPEDEKKYFSPWVKKVQERFKIEVLYKNLLMKLAQGPNG